MVKRAGYTGFDSDNPFYGKDKNMRFSEFEDIHEKVVKRPPQKKSIKR